MPPPPFISPPESTNRSSNSRVVLYHQTHYLPDGRYVSLLPLLNPSHGTVESTSISSNSDQSRPHVTHIIIAAIHLNASPNDITLNDDPPNHPKHNQLWREVSILQAAGVKVLGMLGGAAQGSFRRLDILSIPGQFTDDLLPDEIDENFELFYAPLHRLIATNHLDGLDLDVEEPMSLPGIMRLITRLKADFGPDFLITLAPVAYALQGTGSAQHLSGFDYELLEVMSGEYIAWYNTQFYNGWGTLESLEHYDSIISRGWRRDKIVVGVLTNQGNGAQGYVHWDVLEPLLRALKGRYTEFGGVMGWEYFNAMPGREGRPWEWATVANSAVKDIR